MQGGRDQRIQGGLRLEQEIKDFLAARERQLDSAAPISDREARDDAPDRHLSLVQRKKARARANTPPRPLVPERKVSLIELRGIVPATPPSYAYAPTATQVL